MAFQESWAKPFLHVTSIGRIGAVPEFRIVSIHPERQRPQIAVTGAARTVSPEHETPVLVVGSTGDTVDVDLVEVIRPVRSNKNSNLTRAVARASNSRYPRGCRLDPADEEGYGPPSMSCEFCMFDRGILIEDLLLREQIWITDSIAAVCTGRLRV